MCFVGEQNLYITLRDAILLIISITYNIIAPAKVELFDFIDGTQPELIRNKGGNLFHIQRPIHRFGEVVVTYHRKATSRALQ